MATFILACVFIAKAIIMNFSEDWDASIQNLATKFQLDQFTNNRDLLSDRKKTGNTYIHRDYHPHLPLKKGSSKYLVSKSNVAFLVYCHGMIVDKWTKVTLPLYGLCVKCSIVYVVDVKISVSSMFASCLTSKSYFQATQ